jgi:hypothetical protein
MDGQKAKGPSFSGRYAAMQVPADTEKPANLKPKLGEILIGAELISDRTFYECLMHAEQSAQPVGKVIVGFNYASDSDIDSALLIQSLISDNKIKAKAGIDILREATRQRVAVVELLKTLGSVHTEARVEGNYLGRFLADCQLMGSEQLGQAVAVSQEFDLQLVRVLVHNGSLTIDLASKALDALARVKAGKLDYQVAVAALQYVHKTGATLEDALRTCKVKYISEAGHMLLGEIIGRAGIASEIEILAAVETALSKGKKVGESLVAAGALTPLTLQNALALQDLVSKGVLEKERALLILRRLVIENRELSEFSKTTGIFRDEPEFYRGVLNLLYSSLLVAGGEIIAAYKEKEDYGMDSIRALLATGRLTVKRFLLAREVYFMILDKRIAEELGLQALRVANSDGLSVYEALKAIEPKEAPQAVQCEMFELPPAISNEPETQPPAATGERPVPEKLWRKLRGLLPSKNVG